MSFRMGDEGIESPLVEIFGMPKKIKHPW